MAYSLNTLDAEGTERFSLRRSVGRLIQETGLVLGLALIIFVLMALLSHSALDEAFMTSGTGGAVRNWAGHSGAYLSDLGFALFGYSVWWAVAAGIRAWLGALARWMRLEPQTSPADLAGAGELERMLATRAGFWLGLVLLMVASCALEWSRLYRLDAVVPGGHAGGILGHFSGQLMQNWFGFTGSGLLCIAGVVFGLAAVFRFSWSSLAERIGRALEALVQARRIRREVAEDEAVGRRAVRERRDESPSTTLDDVVEPAAFSPTPQPRVIEPPVAEPAKSERVVKERQKPLFKDLPDSNLPQVDLLDEALVKQDTVSPEVLEMTSRLIEKKLKDFGVEVQVVAAAPGPVITRYEIEPATGVKGSQIVNLAKDLARSLSLVSIRVVETIPGKNFMALELPNAKRQTIRLSEILGSQVYHEAKSLLTVGLGKDIVGNPIVADLAKMPHALVAGTTGSGKSVGINAMILSLLYKAEPKDVRLLMIDPKMLEMSVYEGIPHLLCPVVTDMKQAANGLNWCVAEMERRYKLMSKVGVRNLAGFNQKVDEAKARGEFIYNPFSLTPDDPEPLDRLPHIVVIIDELADLMMVVGKKIEELIARLAQKARAAGIHLLLATQRPSVDVITGLIKANIPTRIAFQVSSKIDSRTILDQMGAEALLGMGDMLYMPSGTSLPTRVHGAFVSDDEVHRVVEYLKTQGEPNYIDGVLEGGTVDGEDTSYGGGDGEGGEKDPMYDQAVEVVLKDRKASISYVQRKLRIGYNRSARLLEDMENAGVVSALGANGQRDILVPARNGE
ncbi:cell division protein FtsK [Comamonas serinivorans]|uniref:Cell division protein FtsK n=1 Tax=Comamonas serinivorans TaxID=1082851 RepID=A0A1Y0ERK8_9BURK|nr:DNA translocase FtsK [Comamonas serinivorans]ARU05892.1 cell division protein FtsK [Comamonas serinivorans]